MAKRFLFVIPPFYGHLNPAIAIAGRLIDRGHEVAWVTSSKMREALPEHAPVYDSISDVYEWCFTKSQQVAGLPRTEQLEVYYQELVIPMAVRMLDDVMRALSEFRPDALLVDRHALSGAIAAECLGLPWATSSPSAQSLGAYTRARQPWIDEQVALLARSYGVPALKELSEALVLSYISPVLAPAGPLPPQLKFVGPAIDADQRTGSDVLPELRPGRRVLVSLSSIYGDLGDAFLLKVAEVIDRIGVQGFFSTTSPVEASLPASAIVRPWLPHPRLFEHFDAVVNHGGSTTIEALYYGKPLIVAPLSFDNFDYSGVVVKAGAGVRVRPTKATIGDVSRAVDEILNNDSYRKAAEAVGASLRQCGGAEAAAEALLQLAA